ncbi:MAG: bifunctional 4-hydroxy-2-oxoglutarate aldolase/2-dehydro-3-deoxy-phosphogluconate aldolase [Acidobacteriota bacterium]
MPTAFDLETTLTEAEIVPRIRLTDPDTLLPTTEALQEGGVKVVEIVAHDSAAFDAITELRKAFPDLVLGAANVTQIIDLQSAVDAGAHYAASPGLTMRLVDAARRRELPYVPGVYTPSEMLGAREQGIRLVELFPARPAGGPRFFGAMAMIFPDLRFRAAGGIDDVSFRDYLRCPNVVAVTATWLVPEPAVQAKDWTRIRDLARTACSREIVHH